MVQTVKLKCVELVSNKYEKNLNSTEEHHYMSNEKNVLRKNFFRVNRSILINLVKNFN